MKTIHMLMVSCLLLTLLTIFSCKNKKEGLVEEGGNTKTTTTNRTNTFLVISDAHIRKGATQNVADSTGDTGEELWQLALDQFTELINGSSQYPKPDFVVLLGDLPYHADPDGDLTLARESTGKVLHDLRKAAQAADVTLIYSPGNNDSWSGDYRAFKAPNGITPFDEDSSGVQDWPVINTGTCTVDSEKACLADNTLDSLGCYSVYPFGKNGGLKIIVMNTVMFADGDSDDTHSWHYYGPAGSQQADTEKQMKWLEQQFSEGNPTDAVMIGMHVPPGLNWKGKPNWDPSLLYNNKSVQDAFLDIVATHQNNIVGVLTSHTHMDGLRKLMDAKGNFSDLIVSIPGIAPGHGNNPGMKMFTYQPTTYEWLDFTTFYTNFWDVNRQKGTVPSTWGNQTFSFNTIFENTQKIPMTEFISQTPMDSLQNKVLQFYTAYGKKAGTADVNYSLIVKPGQ